MAVLEPEKRTAAFISMDDTNYQNVRDSDLLGPFIGARVVDITQHDEEEYRETRQSYVALHFDNGATLQFPIGDDGFQILDIETGRVE